MRHTLGRLARRARLRRHLRPAAPRRGSAGRRVRGAGRRPERLSPPVAAAPPCGRTGLDPTRCSIDGRRRGAIRLSASVTGRQPRSASRACPCRSSAHTRRQTDAPPAVDGQAGRHRIGDAGAPRLVAGQRPRAHSRRPRDGARRAQRRRSGAPPHRPGLAGAAAPWPDPPRPVGDCRRRRRRAPGDAAQPRHRRARARRNGAGASGVAAGAALDVAARTHRGTRRGPPAGAARRRLPGPHRDRRRAALDAAVRRRNVEPAVRPACRFVPADGPRARALRALGRADGH